MPGRERRQTQRYTDATERQTGFRKSGPEQQAAQAARRGQRVEDAAAARATAQAAQAPVAAGDAGRRRRSLVGAASAGGRRKRRHVAAGTEAAGQAGSPRRVALVEPHAASISLLSQRPAHPTHRPGRARPRGPSRRRLAAVGFRNGCPDLPAGCLWAACHCSAACCWSSVCLSGLSARPLLQRVHPCSGPCQSCSSWGCSGVLGVPRMALGGSRNVLGGQDLNGRPVLSF